MNNIYMEKVLNIINHHELQIKITMKSHFTPIRMSIIKKTRNNVDKNVERREHLYTVGRNVK